MPGRSDRNLRFGNMAEDDALAALRQLAVIARPDRGDDVGFDAACTLLRGRGRDALATSTFLVQVKSASRKYEDYDEDAVNWLRRTKLPLYFVTLARRERRLKMYSLHGLFAFARGWWPKTVRFHFAASVATKRSSPEDRLELPIGPPILDLKIDDLLEYSACEDVSARLESWVARDQEHLELSQISVAMPSARMTNQEPGHWAFMMNVNPVDIQEDIRRCFPWFAKLVGHAITPAVKATPNGDGIGVGALLLTDWLHASCEDAQTRHALGGLKTSLMLSFAGSTSRTPVDVDPTGS